MRRVVISGVFAACLIVAAAAPSLAQGNTFTFPLTCGGTTYQVTVGGNGNWVPARDNNSTLVFHPTTFGEFTGTFYPADGSDPQTETDPPEVFQAQPSNGHPSLDCTYHVEFTDENGTFIGDGGVAGYVTGARNNG